MWAELYSGYFCDSCVTSEKVGIVWTCQTSGHFFHWLRLPTVGLGSRFTKSGATGLPDFSNEICFINLSRLREGKKRLYEEREM